jgi:hypothetical protein
VTSRVDDRFPAVTRRLELKRLGIVGVGGTGSYASTSRQDAGQGDPPPRQRPAPSANAFRSPETFDPGLVHHSIRSILVVF